MGVSQRFVDLAAGAIAREKCHERCPPTRSKLGVCPPRPVAPGCRRIPLRDRRPAARNVKFPDPRDQREDCSVIGATVPAILVYNKKFRPWRTTWTAPGPSKASAPSPWRRMTWRAPSASIARSDLKCIYGGDTAGFTSFRAGSGYLNLIAQPAETQWSWWGRVIFYHSDVDALHAAIIAAGYSPSSAPRDAEWGERFFHITDPDEHELSFAWPLR